jgi:transposase InsO family protein
MKRLGLQGAVRGKRVRTTIADAASPRPLDRVNRQFTADRPNQLWVSDLCFDVAGQVVRCLRCGRVRSTHCRLARQFFHDERFRTGCA